MKTSAEFKPETGFGLLLLGHPKMGKTTLAMMFPKPYIADCDNNMGGAVRMLKEIMPEQTFKYDCITMQDDGKVVEPKDRWARLIQCCKAAVADPDVKTIIVDSLSNVDEFLCDHIISQKDGSKDKDKMTIADWIPYKTLMAKFVMYFRSSGKMFILTSHLGTEKDELTGQVFHKPNMKSKLQDNFAGFFSDCWLASYEKIGSDYKYFVKTMPQPMYNGLGNSLGLPENFKFTWPEFVKYMNKAGAFKTPDMETILATR